MKQEDKINILLVDDLHINLIILEKALKNPGYNLVKAGSGKEALALLEDQEFAMILLDIRMPGMDGFETARRVRENERTRDIPIVFVTAEMISPKHISEGYALDAVDYIIRPFDRNMLRNRVALLADLYQKKVLLQKQARELYETGAELERMLKARDIELKLLEEEIVRRKRTEAELEQSNRELDDFAYTVSHDLREPLRGINSFSEFLLEDYSDKLDNQGRTMLETLIRLAKRLDDQISAILRYSRIGHLELTLEETDINSVVRDVIDSVGFSIDEKHIAIRIPRTLPTVRCDRSRVAEVFQNLITNAIKYNDKPEKWIEIGFMENKETLFYVRDNGIGIKEEHQDKIFGIFKRLHKKEAYGGGTGAGLTIVKKIVERHGGCVQVESEIGKGTTFYFTLAKL